MTQHYSCQPEPDPFLQTSRFTGPELDPLRVRVNPTRPADTARPGTASWHRRAFGKPSARQQCPASGVSDVRHPAVVGCDVITIHAAGCDAGPVEMTRSDSGHRSRRGGEERSVLGKKSACTEYRVFSKNSIQALFCLKPKVHLPPIRTEDGRATKPIRRDKNPETKHRLGERVGAAKAGMGAQARSHLVYADNSRPADFAHTRAYMPRA
ncbi:hypothetical protein MA16_Dca012636 [Dendrobium catenatum]|uniref:Uncharacterized protein n=1 Tax=Dendrobium catenatum TaxID=906689 RepID=A0A2I0VMY5_9ASPA|nr:hypothetical protein MA16_Dca012636 [Dendrobium catenatum]